MLKNINTVVVDMEEDVVCVLDQIIMNKKNSKKSQLIIKITN